MSVRDEWDDDPAKVLDILIDESRWISKRTQPDRPNDKRAFNEMIRHLKAAKAASRPLYRGAIT